MGYRSSICRPWGPALSADMHRPAVAACTRHSYNCCRELSHLVARMCKRCTALHKGAKPKPSGTSCCRQRLHEGHADAGFCHRICILFCTTIIKMWASLIPGCITKVLLL